MHMPMKQTLLLALLACPLLARAQQPTSPPHTATDSAFLHARELVVGGNGTAGRAIVDSLLAASRPGTPAYGEALYWQASLASSAATAEHDYEHIVVDYPFSPHAADALYALAQLETSRGDRSGAVRHLQELLLEHPEFQERGRAGLALGRLLLDLGQLPRGCAVLARTRAGVPATQVELLNQIDYYGARCEGVDTTVVAAAPPARTRTTPRTAAESTRTAGQRSDSGSGTHARRESAAPRADTAKHEAPAKTHSSVGAPASAHASHEPTRYTVQVAAYSTSADAARLVKRLRARGMDARVVGTAKPYRVRLGRYESRAAAVAEEKQLKAKGIDGFVTEAETR